MADIRIFKVPAHAGVRGNEAADAIAKDAAKRRVADDGSPGKTETASYWLQSTNCKTQPILPHQSVDSDAKRGKLPAHLKSAPFEKKLPLSFEDFDTLYNDTVSPLDIATHPPVYKKVPEPCLSIWVNNFWIS